MDSSHQSVPGSNPKPRHVFEVYDAAEGHPQKRGQQLISVGCLTPSALELGKGTKRELVQFQPPW